MADLAYRTAYAMNRVEARMQLVRTYQETGSLSETARRWKTCRHTVRKWMRRFEAEGKAGLDDRGHAAHRGGLGQH
ncbi:MAG: helix-turn-helix domain-containing protein [Anaerolineae bacterium]|nr:helix-turn-helix domain-containing protein [Anaerolineae bacterium]